MAVPAAKEPGPEIRPGRVGDELEGTVRRHLLGTWRFLLALGCPAQLADDLTQEAFLVAWRKRAYALEPAALGAFLRRTARFLWLRSKKPQPIPERLADAVEQLWVRECAADGGEELGRAVRACVDELADKPARAVNLVYGHGMTRAQAAAALDMRENGVKTLLQRTRAVLRECLRRKGW